MKWHEVVVNKNASRDRVKHVMTQHCHIAEWHDGLKCSGKAGMPFRTTSIKDDPMWRTSQINSLLPCWMLIADGLHVSKQQKSEYCHKTVFHILGYRKLAARWIHIRFQLIIDNSLLKCNPSPLPCWTSTKGKVTTFLDESSLWAKPGLTYTNQT